MATVKVLLRHGSEATEVSHDLVSDISIGSPPGQTASSDQSDHMYESSNDYLNIEMMDDSAHYNMLNVVGWHRQE